MLVQSGPVLMRAAAALLTTGSQEKLLLLVEVEARQEEVMSGDSNT